MQRPRRDLVAREPAHPHPFAFEERAGHLDQGMAAPVARRIAQRIPVRIEAVQQRRLHRGAPDLPLVKAAGADVRPGLDGAISLGRPVDQQAARRIECHPIADQGIGDRLIEPKLARRVVDAGDAGAFLGDHPPGNILGTCSRNAAIVVPRMIASLARGAVAAVLGVQLGGRGFRHCRGLGALAGQTVLVGSAGSDAVRGIGFGRGHRLIHVFVLRLLGVLRPVDAGTVPCTDEAAGRERLTLAEAGTAVGADRHRRQLQRLPVDRSPHRHLAVLLADLVGADDIADRDIADDAGANVLPQRLDVLPRTEANGGAALVAVVVPRDPRPLDHADDAGEVEGAVRVQQRRTAVEARKIDVPGVERQHLVVALAGPQIPPPHRGPRRPDDLDSARLGIDGLGLQPDVGARLQRQVDDVLFRHYRAFLSHVPGMITP